MMNFEVNQDGEVILLKTGLQTARKLDHFEQARGKANIHWRTDQLLALLRHEEALPKS